MELIATRTGDGVHHAPGGPPVFGRVVRSVHLELLHRRLGGGVADAGAAALLGEERLVVVHAVEGVVVEQHADAAKTQQAIAVLVGGHALGLQREVRPSAAVAGQVLKRRVAQVGGDGRGACIEPGSLRPHHNGLMCSTDREPGSQRGHTAHLDDNRVGPPGCEIRRRGFDRICVRYQVGDAKSPGCVGDGAALLAGGEVAGDDARSGQRTLLAVGDRSAKGPCRRGLPLDCTRGREDHDHKRQGGEAGRQRKRESSARHGGISPATELRSRQIPLGRKETARGEDDFASREKSGRRAGC